LADDDVISAFFGDEMKEDAEEEKFSKLILDCDTWT
jgi:hypothetical protein